MKKLLGILVLGLLLNGCATVKPTGGLYKDTTLESEKSRIIIFRRGGSLISYDVPSIRIRNDSYFEKAFLPSKSYIQDDVNPGKYTIFVGKASDPALVWRFDPFEIDVRVRKNETVFLELVTWSVGYVSRAKIEIVDKEFASNKLKSLQRALPSDIIDK